MTIILPHHTHEPEWNGVAYRVVGVVSQDVVRFFYGILIFGGLILGGFWIASHFGGVANVTATLAQTNPELLTVPGPNGYFSYSKTSSMLFVMAFGGLLTLPMWLRMYSVKSESTFRYSISFMGIIALGYLGTMLAALCGVIDQPNFAEPDNIFPYMLTHYTPILVASLVLAAAAAAAMSTANSQVHAISTIVSLDIYKEYIKKDATQQRIINVGRIVLILFSGFAYILALNSANLLLNLGLLAMGGTLQLLPGLLGIFILAACNSQRRHCWDRCRLYYLSFGGVCASIKSNFSFCVA